ncbi:ark1, partial [Symbiodinium necroappetens]
EGGSRSSSKEASELGTPAEAKRALDFGLPDTKERGDAFHLSQADQLGFGFGICSRSGSKDSTSSARLRGKDASPSSPWSESETFAAVRDWLKSPTAIANDLGLDTRRDRSDTEPSGIFQDALSRTHAGVKSLITKPDADPLSQTSSISRPAHADGRILPKPKQKMASPTASRRASADTELREESIDISVAVSECLGRSGVIADSVVGPTTSGTVCWSAWASNFQFCEVFARQAKQQQPLAQPMAREPRRPCLHIDLSTVLKLLLSL